ncbi:MAG: succinate dehydrogenase/fumarate reductase iron-sulfur subunit [Halobacteriales archaeon]|nr:succinate dehydrogenase/fumarate reductase iron-sulfur subunit [Halobacteriales archaeon]
MAQRGNVTMRLWRGTAAGGQFVDYQVAREEGMVVLDAVHAVQAQQANDLSVRWNCKAGKCGSCSAEVNGYPRLMCMTRLDLFDPGEPITVAPLKTFPLVKDLVTNVRWNFESAKRIPPLKPGPLTAEEQRKGEFQMMQQDVDRIQEFRKCIECFLCQDTCHVLRDAQDTDKFFGPRQMIRLANLEMHPKDSADRIPMIKKEAGVGMCNITKCCTEVCPEHIRITDNGIIPLKERVVDRYYDPVTMLLNALRPGNTKLR